MATFRIEFQDQERQEQYRVQPGQFNMIYVPGVGEVPISVSSAPEEKTGHRPHDPVRRAGHARDRQSGTGRSRGSAWSVRSRLADRAGPRPRRGAGGRRSGAGATCGSS